MKEMDEKSYKVSKMKKEFGNYKLSLYYNSTNSTKVSW